jgi:hypothetical protein
MAEVNTNLKVKFDVCESANCRFFTIKDTIGVYNSISNPGGWDASEAANPAASEVNEVTITVVTPAGVSYTFDSSSTLPTTSYLPDLNQLLEYPILYSSIGSTDKIIDGVYEITVEYAGDFGINEYTASATCEYLMTCQISCCIDKLAKEIAKSQCLDCKKEAIEKLETAQRYIKAAKDAMACGMANLAKLNLAAAQWYCNERNCKSCFK